MLRDQMTRYTELVSILAPHKVGRLKISQFIPNGICPNKVQSKINSGGVSAILRPGQILENIQRMFLLTVWATGTMSTNFDENLSSECFRENNQISYYRLYHQKGFDFPLTSHFIWTNSISYNRDILKRLPFLI